MIAARAEALFPNPEGQDPSAVRSPVRASKCRKGQVLFQFTQVFQGSRKAPQSSFRERSLQKVVFRLSEMIRLERLGQCQTRAYGALASHVARWHELRQGDTEHKLRIARGLLETLRALSGQETSCGLEGVFASEHH